MNINVRNRFFPFLLNICFILLAVGCSGLNDDALPNENRDEVMFTTALPSLPATRSAKSDYNNRMAAYKAVSDQYEFTVEMYSGDNHLEGTSTYCPVEDGSDIGSLIALPNATPLYWPSTTTPYAFKATAGTETLSADQSTAADLLQQDRLEGFGYIQKWIGTDDEGAPLDQIDALNYHTAKEWRDLNKDTKLVVNDADYKKIPLYLQHKRSLITVILKAGEGVSRKALAFDVAEKDLYTQIISYKEGSQAIEPLASEVLVDYEADVNGASENGVSTTRYDAIVEPYDYSENPSEDVIVKISLSGQHYSFYAGNDYNFDTNKSNYILEPGKHLTLTVILSRDSRKIAMTAYVEDWTEEVTNTICDDYGNAGEPIKISNRKELISFLEDENRNKAGNIALVTNNIDLETWTQDYDLNCTLNLGGCTLESNHRFLRTMGHAASLQNGTIQIGSEVDAAIALTNHGTIEDIRVTTAQHATAYATIAGAVVSNSGTISRCHSSLKVQGDNNTAFVGGIAATSLSAEGKTAMIDGCMVSNSVKGGMKGGGIVGQASGYVSNNTFEYGITLLQENATHKNIIGEIETAHALKAENNAWPTKDENYNLANATAEFSRYDGIIDNALELKASTAVAYNVAGRRYRLAQDIMVTENVGSVAYNLDGNGKKISTSAQIFNAITGQLHDFTVYVTKNLKSVPDMTNATDAMAPLAYEVYGETAEISHVNVKTAKDVTITASNPAGLVVWAWGGATISSCEARVNLFADVEASITQGRKFAGGIVSTVSRATVTQCVLHTGSTFAGTASTIIYYGGIVGGIEKKEGSGYDAELTITDCTNFVTLPKDSHYGAILGNAQIGVYNATSKDCQGNWWSSDSYGVGTYVGSVEKTIGKRNALTPTEKEF